MWKHFYHTSNSRECMEVNGKPLKLHAVPYFLLQSDCENPYQYCNSHENPHQVLQVMCAVSDLAMRVCMIKSLSP